MHRDASLLDVHFNPRSREGSDLNTFNKTGQSGDFNPRSREGSDTMPCPVHRNGMNFNPRSREGSDGDLIDDCPVFEVISIHAPARGATEILSDSGGAYHNFNPRSREGSDVNET